MMGTTARAMAAAVAMMILCLIFIAENYLLQPLLLCDISSNQTWPENTPALPGIVLIWQSTVKSYQMIELDGHFQN